MCLIIVDSVKWNTKTLHLEMLKGGKYWNKRMLGQGQLTVKCSSNLMLPRFQEPILDKVRLG